MTLITSNFDPEDIDRAGDILVAGPQSGLEDEWLKAFILVGQWRASHSRPLNTFRANLRRRVGGGDIVAQRLKRLPSIIAKLERLDWLKLSRMQDIGGCRAVVSGADEAFRLAADFADSRIRHELVSYNNYIDRPRTTGYRGLHMVYSYHSDRTDRWNGLKTEIQIRSQLQHQWATAVETVGTFTGDSLKSGIGDRDWLRFFALMSAAIARREGTNPVPGTPANRSELVSEIARHDQALGISYRLAVFQTVAVQLQDIREIQDHWFGLELDLALNPVQISVEIFDANDWESANVWYSDRESENRDNPLVIVVLVSSNSLAELRRAYPNFFADISQFRQLLQETVQ